MAKLKNAKQRLQRLMRNHCKWFADTGLATERSMNETFNLHIDELSMEAANMIAFSLGGLAKTYGSQGACLINQKSRDASIFISKSLIYRFWSIKIRLLSTIRRILLKSTMSTDYVSQTANLVCCLPEHNAEAFNTLQVLMENPRCNHPSYLSQASFEPFVLYFGAKLYKTIEIAELDMRNPYRWITDHWADHSLLAEHLALVCDYHLARTIDRGSDWPPEFYRVPFDILPSEVLLIRRCKAHLGEEMPSVDHPLVQLFDESIGPLAPYEGDPLLAKAIRHCERVFR